MNKEKQIEEIEQFIYDYVDSKQTEKVYLCSSRVNELAKPFVHNKALANALYNAGYRKVHDGAVISMIKSENACLSAENTELKKQLADLQKNTAEAIGGMYNGHFSAQEQFVIYVKREMNKIFEPFISKDHNAVKDCAVYNLGVAVDAEGKDDNVCPYNMGEDVELDEVEE